jgi:hypothetical protein
MPPFEGGVFFAQTLNFIFEVFVGHAWASLFSTSPTLPLLAQHL